MKKPNTQLVKFILFVLYTILGFWLVVHLVKINDAFFILFIVYGILLVTFGLMLKATIKCPNCSRTGNITKNYKTVPCTLKCHYCGHEF